DIINTVGNVPLEWYRFHDHIGYDKSGAKVKQLHKSNIDELVDRVGNPNAWRTVKDIYNGREIEIDLDTIIAAKRMVANHLGSDELMKQIQISPDNNALKEDFLSQQKQKQSALSLKQTENSQTRVALRIMRNWMEHKLRGDDLSKKRNNRFYDLWSVDTKLPGYVRSRKTMPPPPSFKPGHCESYNPPEEYLFSDKEIEQWNNNHPALRTAFSCIPQKSDSLCYIKNDPNGYLDFVGTRCDNLFSCPRISVNRMPDSLRSTDLLPKIKLPTIANSINLKEKLKFIGHKGYVKHLAMHRNSIHMASASHDKTIRIWNVRTGRCIVSFSVCSQISQIAWLPLDNFSVLSYSYDRTIVIKAIDLSSNASIKSNNELYFSKPSNI
ncbi:MAG: Ribosome biogenesis protein 1, partial [Marteilia pararefringens]